MHPDEALIRASFFLDKAEFIMIGIPEDQCWYRIYHWRRDPNIVKDGEDHYLLLRGDVIELRYKVINDDNN
jgi:hypothetical protein